MVRSYTYDDGKEELLQDTFEREPFIVQFRTANAGNSYQEPIKLNTCFLPNDTTFISTVIQDFVMVAIHTSPSSAPQEVDNLVDVYDDVVAKWSIDDVIILGDFNSACNYMSDSDWKVNRLYNDKRFTWVTQDCMDTTVGSTVCAYDRYMLSHKRHIRRFKVSHNPVFPKYQELCDTCDIDGGHASSSCGSFRVLRCYYMPKKI